MKCPRQFFWAKTRKEDALPPGPALMIGRHFHDLAEQFQKHVDNPETQGTSFDYEGRIGKLGLEEKYRKDLFFMVRRFVMDMPFEAGQHPWIEHVLGIGEKFTAIPLSKYHKSQAKGDNRVLSGVIDRNYFPADGVFDEKPTVAHVTDWKTSRNEDVDIRQMQCYAYLLQKEVPSLEKVQVTIWFARSGQTTDVDGVPKTFVKKDLEDFARWFMKLAKEINDDEKFDPTPNPYCNWCDFRHKCQAWKELPCATPADKVTLIHQAKAFASGLSDELKTLLKAGGSKQIRAEKNLIAEFRQDKDSQTVDPAKFIDWYADLYEVSRDDAYLTLVQKGAIKVDLTSKFMKGLLKDKLVAKGLLEISEVKPGSSRLYIGAEDKTKDAITGEEKKKPKRKRVTKKVDPVEATKAILAEEATLTTGQQQLVESKTLPVDYDHGKAIAQSHKCNEENRGCDVCKPSRRKALEMGWERPWGECGNMGCGEQVPWNEETNRYATPDEMAVADPVTCRPVDSEREPVLRKAIQDEIRKKARERDVSKADLRSIMFACTGKGSARGVPTYGSGSLDEAAKFLAGATDKDLKVAVKGGREWEEGGK